MKAKKVLQDNQKYLVDLGKSETVLQDWYPVFVYSVQIDNIDPDKTKAKTHIQAENQILYPDLRI
jgi:hypothetical protein